MVAGRRADHPPPPAPPPAEEGSYFQSSRSCPSADGHLETMKCHSERSEESCSASGIPPAKDQGEIPRGVYPERPERDSFTSFRTGSSRSLP